MSAVKRSLNVGVIGLGNMGLPIARNIAFKARSSVYLQLHSRTKSKLKIISEDMQADGVTCALRLHDKYSSMSKWCDILILCLKDQAAAEHVLLSAGGGGEDSPLLSPQSARQGQIIIDHTTAAVPFAKHCGQLAAQLGVHYLDAPLSGSPRQAFQNQLVTMIGSNANQLNAGEDVVQRLYPILNMYCDHIHSMGESGAGQATKLVSAALVASHNSAAAEAMTMAHRLNLEYSSYPKSNAPNRQDSFTHSFLNQNALIKVLDASWASSTMLRRNASTMQDIIRNPDQLPPTSGLTVDHLLQDLQYLDDTLRQAHPPAADGGEVEDPYPVLDASLRMLGSAKNGNMGDRDVSSVIHFIEAADILEKEEKLYNHPAPPQEEVGKKTETVEEKAKTSGKVDNEFDGDFY